MEAHVKKESTTEEQDGRRSVADSGGDPLDFSGDPLEHLGRALIC